MIQTVRENLDEIERFIHSGKNDSSQHRARKRKASSTISNSAGRGNSQKNSKKTKSRSSSITSLSSSVPESTLTGFRGDYKRWFNENGFERPPQESYLLPDNGSSSLYELLVKAIDIYVDNFQSPSDTSVYGKGLKLNDFVGMIHSTSMINKEILKTEIGFKGLKNHISSLLQKASIDKVVHCWDKSIWRILPKEGRVKQQEEKRN